MNNTKLDDVLQKIDSLPQMFNVAIAVANKLEDPEVSVSELAKLITVDQVLTTQLLKLCNSAYFSFSRKIATIQDAIPRLGLKALKEIIFLSVSQSMLKKPVDGYALNANDMWLSSVSCSMYAKYIAEKVNYKDSELAFTAALLRDIGKLAIHDYVGSEYSKIVSMVNEKMISFAKAEYEILGFNHMEIGAKLAEKWNFPQSLVDVIRYHHAPSEYKLNVEQVSNDTVKLLAIVHLADAITMMMGTGLGNDGLMYKTDSVIFDELGISQSAEDIEMLVMELVDLGPKIQEMADMVNG